MFCGVQGETVMNTLTTNNRNQQQPNKSLNHLNVILWNCFLEFKLLPISFVQNWIKNFSSTSSQQIISYRIKKTIKIKSKNCSSWKYFRFNRCSDTAHPLLHSQFVTTTSVAAFLQIYESSSYHLIPPQHLNSTLSPHKLMTFLSAKSWSIFCADK